MSSKTTVSARDVADSVGLPPVWRDTGCPSFAPDWWEPGDLKMQVDRGADVDLADPQTAYGVALALDAWERGWADAGPPDEWDCYSWAAACDPSTYNQRLARALLRDRIQHIARDHRIRRSLGRGVQPGTLAEWERRGANGWSFRDAEHPAYWFDVEEFPALAGITDPAEALRVLDEVIDKDDRP